MNYTLDRLLLFQIKYKYTLYFSFLSFTLLIFLSRLFIAFVRLLFAIDPLNPTNDIFYIPIWKTKRNEIERNEHRSGGRKYSIVPLSWFVLRFSFLANHCLSRSICQPSDPTNIILEIIKSWSALARDIRITRVSREKCRIVEQKFDDIRKLFVAKRRFDGYK